MSDSSASTITTTLAKGDYCPAGPSDIRSPCPILNSLANHGYLPRDGRNARTSDFKVAMNRIGVSHALGSMLSNAIFLEREADGKPKKRSLFAKIWYYICNPLALIFSRAGVRNPGQEDSAGRPCLNLDQLSTPGVIEHDISLSRHDFAQGDNHTKQPELVEALLASSSDGKTLTLDDLVRFRQRRIEEQKVANKQLNPTAAANGIGWGELAFVLHVFGDGKKVDTDRVRAIFSEERLPIKEGWIKRWWTVGIVELVTSTKKVKKIAGIS